MNTITQFSNVGSPSLGDFIILPGCGHGCHTRQEGYVVDTTWVQEGHYSQYTLVTVLNPTEQVRFQVKHTTFNDDNAPEGAINWFF